MKLERFDRGTIMMSLDNFPLKPSPKGEFVKFEDVVSLIHQLRLVATGYDFAMDSPAMAPFVDCNKEILDAITDRDFAIGAAIEDYFESENGC